MMAPEGLEPECPRCRTRIGGHTNVELDDGSEPAPGDLCVCAECGYILIFVGPGLRCATARDLLGLDRDRQLALARAIAFFHWYKSRKKD